MNSFALLNIGSELLNGRTVNTNATFIGELLFTAGFPLKETVVIHDIASEIEQTVNTLLSNHDVLIITGGLGPTQDDITKHALKKIFGGDFIVHQPTLDKLVAWYKKRKREINEAMRLQASVPDTCEVLPNNMGTAPGMSFNPGNKLVFSLPGIPSEMKHLMIEQVMPILKDRFSPKKQRIP